MYQDTTSRMLRSTSEAIDRAMAQLWEAKVKFVHVNFSIEKKSVDRPKGWKGNPNVNGVNSLMSNADHDPEWVHVSLSAVPGVNMEDVDEQEPPRRKDHRRVPSTIAMEEVKVGL